MSNINPHSSPHSHSKDPLANLPPNPYKGLPKGDQFRLNIDVDIADALFIKSISPRHGTTQNIIALYVKSIVLECKSLGVTSFSPENLRKFHSIILRYAHPSLTGETRESDDRPREAGVRESYSHIENLGANAPGDDVERGERGRGRERERERDVKQTQKKKKL
jgi:hypothetical protein